MKKVFLIICLGLAASIVYFLLFWQVSEKRYNKIICYYVARDLTKGSGGFDDRVNALKSFVHENIHPIAGYYNSDDTKPVEKFISGIGWCDQQARVFMDLGSSVGITSRLLFLRLKNGPSPHSIAEALGPDKRWVIVDPLYDLTLINDHSKLSSQEDIKKDPKIVAENIRVKSRSAFEKRWSDPEFLSIYHETPSYITTKRGVNFDFLRYAPLRVLRPIVRIVTDKYLEKAKASFKNAYEFKMAKARLYHLMGYYDEGHRLYDEIIRDSNDPGLIRKTEFYKAVCLKDEKKYDSCCEYITSVISKDLGSPYRAYLIGLRSRALNKIGRIEYAEADARSIEYDLTAW